MFEHVVFHAVEAECSRGVEAERFEVARHDFHRGNASGLHRRDETLPAREGIFGPLPPEPEA